MSKRLPIFLSTLMLTIGSLGLPAHSSFAKVITDDGLEAWSIEEMRELYYEAEAKKDLLCKDSRDSECRRDLAFEWAMEDPRYNSLEMYSMLMFVISAYNPANNTLRLYYRDIDSMALEMLGEEIHSPLTELDIAWLDSDFNERTHSFLTEMRAGRSWSSLHEIYRGTADSNGEGWFPVETEIEITIPEGIDLNSDGHIAFYALSETSSVMSWVYPSRCINLPSYEVGMECRIMFNETGNTTYVPFKIEAPIENEPEENKAVENTENSQEEGGVVVVKNIELADATQSTSMTSSEPVQTKAKIVAIENDKASPIVTHSEDVVAAAPLSAINDKIDVPTSGELSRKEKEFPWWIIAVLFIGVTLILWLFWPNRKNKSQK